MRRCRRDRVAQPRAPRAAEPRRVRAGHALRVRAAHAAEITVVHRGGEEDAPLRDAAIEARIHGHARIAHVRIAHLRIRRSGVEGRRRVVFGGDAAGFLEIEARARAAGDDADDYRYRCEGKDEAAHSAHRLSR